MTDHERPFAPGPADPNGSFDPWRDAGSAADADPDLAAAPPARTQVELLGTQLRVAGTVDMGNFGRLSDYVNFLDGYFMVHDVTLLSRLGEPTRLTFPDLRVRLDEIAVVGQHTQDELPEHDERYINKDRRRLVVTTAAQIVYGYAFVYELASTTAFVDATDPPFIPLVNVRVRWLADRRLAGRFAFALVQRSHIVGVATEVSGGLHLLAGRGASASR